jgi:hypothetical protein
MTAVTETVCDQRSRLTPTKPQVSDSNKEFVFGPLVGLDIKTHRSTDRQSNRYSHFDSGVSKIRPWVPWDSELRIAWWRVPTAVAASRLKQARRYWSHAIADDRWSPHSVGLVWRFCAAASVVCPSGLTARYIRSTFDFTVIGNGTSVWISSLRWRSV